MNKEDLLNQYSDLANAYEKAKINSLIGSSLCAAPVSYLGVYPSLETFISSSSLRLLIAFASSYLLIFVIRFALNSLGDLISPITALGGGDRSALISVITNLQDKVNKLEDIVKRTQPEAAYEDDENKKGSDD